MTIPVTCEFCDKRGLPILLVRDAIAPAGGGAPLAPALPIELSAKAAHYTKRLLRSGYVNVFDEARRRWEAYFVTKDGYLFKLLETPGVITPTPKKPFNCPDEGHRAVASCITVPDPRNASKVWVGFSEVRWTDSVKKANESAAYRKRHMTEIDIKAVLQDHQSPHQPISLVEATVAEFSMAAGLAKANFSWSPSQFQSRQGRAERLKQECEAMRPGRGIIVTLSDPAGIAQELAILMKRNEDLFINNNPENKRNLAASGAIEQIEEAVRKQAEGTEIAAADYLGDQHAETNSFGQLFSSSVQAQTNKVRNVTETNLRHASDDAWKKYSAKFDDKARMAWHEPFSQKLNAFDATYIAPLALSHVAWMKSKTMTDYFQCNFDPKHAESGLVYTSAITHCLTSTQDKHACADLYSEWLKGDVADPDNLLLRAMTLNQDLVAEEIKAAITVSADARQIPWDNIFAAYSAAVERVGEAPHDVMARLVVQIAGPIARTLNRVVDGGYGLRGAMMAIGLVSGHPVVVCDVVGSKREFRAHLIRQLLQASGQAVSEKRLDQAVSAELARQRIRGVDLSGTHRTRWVIVADKEMIARMPPGLKPQARAEWVARSIKTVDALESLHLNRWRAVINENFRGGLVTAILQVFCLSKLFSDAEKSLAHDKRDANGRMYASLGAIAATTSETIGKALFGNAAPGLRFGQGLALNAGTICLRTGVAIGVCAGLFVACLDGVKAYEAKQENQFGLAWLYAGSTVIGLGLTLAMLYAFSLGALAIPIIGLLIVLSIGIGILIDQLKNNPIQEWLERCPWGILKAQRYTSYDVQQAQLVNALR
jgi:hypothetical protein